MGREQLLHVTVTLLLNLLDLLVLRDCFFELVHGCLFLFNLLLEFGQDFVLVFVCGLIQSHVFFQPLQSFFHFNPVTKEVVVVFFLSTVLIVIVLVLSLGHLFISQKFLDLCRLFPVQLVLQSLVSNLFLRLQLHLEFLILGIGKFLGLSKLLSLIIELLSHLSKELHLDVEELDLNFGLFNLLAQFCGLLQRSLVVFHCLKVFYDLRGVGNELVQFLLLAVFQCGDKLDFKVVPVLVFIIEGRLFVLVNFVFVVSRFRLVAVVVQRAQLSIERVVLLAVVALVPIQLTVKHLLTITELTLLILESLRLLLDDLDLSIEDELLPLDLQRLLAQILQISVEVALHLRILRLEQADVLVTGLIIVVQATNAALLLIFDHLLTQDFELQFHEVDLLLQVDDVLIGLVHVRVATELPRSELLLLLASEVHHWG